MTSTTAPTGLGIGVRNSDRRCSPKPSNCVTVGFDKPVLSLPKGSLLAERDPPFNLTPLKDFVAASLDGLKREASRISLNLA